MSSKNSFGQIFRSSLLIGGASMVNIFLATIRTKVTALLLGPGGFGLMGMFTSIFDLFQATSGFGVTSSGVRQIAAAHGSGDQEVVARTAYVLRRTSLILGAVGGIALAASSRWVSRLTFNHDGYTWHIAALGLAVFFRSVSGGQTALVQGYRRLKDLARISVIGAASSTLVTIPLVYFFGESGLVPSLIAVALVTVGTSWWFSRGIQVQKVAVSLSDFLSEAKALLKLGFSFMVSGLMVMGSAYLIRLIVVNKEGLGAAGIYQSAWTLGGLYVGFILQAMGADFYPRLTAVAKDNLECNRLVNEQSHVSILLAGPGIIFTLTVAPWILHFFYSKSFSEGVPLLRWICLGMMLRVLAWPMGLIIVAKGAAMTFLVTEVAAAVVHVLVALVCVKYFGVVGAAIAFACLYVWHSILIYLIIRRLSEFRWSTDNLRLIVTFIGIAIAVVAGYNVLPPVGANVFGVLAFTGCGMISLLHLIKLADSLKLPASARRLVEGFRIIKQRVFAL